MQTTRNAHTHQVLPGIKVKFDITMFPDGCQRSFMWTSEVPPKYSYTPLQAPMSATLSFHVQAGSSSSRRLPDPGAGHN